MPERDIAGPGLTTFVNWGITHNFIQDQIVNFLGLPVSTSSKFQVMVGNVDQLYEC